MRTIDNGFGTNIHQRRLFPAGPRGGFDRQLKAAIGYARAHIDPVAHIALQSRSCACKPDGVADIRVVAALSILPPLRKGALHTVALLNASKLAAPSRARSHECDEVHHIIVVDEKPSKVVEGALDANCMPAPICLT